MAQPKKQPARSIPTLADVNEEQPRNAYYDKVAAGYRVAKYLTLFVLVLVILAGFFTGSDSITYANFVYLLRDFDTMLGTGSTETVPAIRYGAADNRHYLTFRDGLTLVGKSGVEIYNRAGTRTLSDDPGFDDPRAAASAQYMLVYDLGGETYALYNSLARIYTETLDYAISGGAISDSGLYAVVTKDRRYTSAVLLYGKNNKLKNRYLKEKYVIDVAISDDGDRIAIVSVSSSDGAYSAEFQLSAPGEDSAIATLTMPGVFPLAVRFYTDNSFAVLCDSAIYFYRDDGEALGNYAFADEGPSRFMLDGDTAALVFPNNVMDTESRVLLFNQSGELYREEVLDGRAQEIALGEDAFYLLTEHRLHRLPLSETHAVESLDYAGGGKALLPTENGVYLCTASTAYRYDAERFSAQIQGEETD